MNKEVWKDVKDYEGLYQISNFGRVKSLLGWDGKRYIKRERILSPSKQSLNPDYGRAVVNLCKDGKRKTFKVHRLVATAFLPNPEGLNIINHIDGNPLNNKVDNLEWCDTLHNVNHALDTELKVNRINTIDRETMVMLLNNGFNYDEIANILCVAKGTVFNYIKKFQIKKIYI